MICLVGLHQLAVASVGLSSLRGGREWMVSSQATEESWWKSHIPGEGWAVAQWSSTCPVCQKHQVPSAAKKMRGFPEMETAGFGDYM